MKSSVLRQVLFVYVVVCGFFLFVFLEVVRVVGWGL